MTIIEIQESEIVGAIKWHINTKYGSQMDCSKALNIAQSNLSQATSGGSIPTQLLSDMGVEKITLYRTIDK